MLFSSEHESEELNKLNLEFDSLIIESEDDDESDESQGALVSPMEPPNEDDELEDEEGSSQPIRGVWSDTIMRPKRWNFDDNLCGIQKNWLDGCEEPLDYYCALLDDALLDLIVTETNRYGSQKL
ncbi:hypothetical protein GCK32_022856 [Trichostrongylus colubriformis]|uniref:Uncharacterized protein n=1 Tax=Trichostrongylus colubriformis TaxID=6319 RepID=A0AAN8J332_TRICO